MESSPLPTPPGPLKLRLFGEKLDLGDILRFRNLKKGTLGSTFSYKM
jgi:hypothetical protein